MHARKVCQSRLQRLKDETDRVSIHPQMGLAHSCCDCVENTYGQNICFLKYPEPCGGDGFFNPLQVAIFQAAVLS